LLVVGSHVFSILWEGIGPALIAAGAVGLTRPVFHSLGQEIAEVSFTFTGGDAYDAVLDYTVYHPESPGHEERVLVSGGLTGIQENERHPMLERGGTLGYQQPVFLKLAVRTQGTNLANLSSLMFTLTTRPHMGRFPLTEPRIFDAAAPSASS